MAAKKTQGRTGRTVPKKGGGKTTSRTTENSTAKSTGKGAKKAAKKKSRKTATAAKKTTKKISKKVSSSRSTTTTRKTKTTRVKQTAATARNSQGGSKRSEEATPTRKNKTTASRGASKKSTKKKAARKDSPSSGAPGATAASGAADVPAAPTKRLKGLPALHLLDELPTEELWSYYRRASRNASENAQYLEDLRNLLIERHYPLVRYIAERLLQTLPKSIELDDLISAGLFGLMDAIRGFDPSRGIKFKTYCSTRIRGSILDQLRSQDWVPRLVRLKAGKIERALQRLTGEFGREPTHSELAKSLEIEHDDLVREMADARAKTMFSLSEKWEDDDGSVEKVEILEDHKAIDPVHELNRRDLMIYMTRSLTHKERFIIEQYYQYGHTMREIGEMLALTESRVCQIHSNVMGRLKSLLQQREDSLST